MHIIVAMVGTGVLAMSSAFAALSWEGGLLLTTGACIISLFTFTLLIKMHEMPIAYMDAEGGTSIRIVRMNRYSELSHYVFGEGQPHGSHPRLLAHIPDSLIGPLDDASVDE